MIFAFVLLEVAMLLFAIGASFQVTRFLSQHDSILEGRHLENFKSLVRKQMYIALVIGILTVPMVIAASYIGFQYGLLGTVGVIASSAPLFLFARYAKSFEVRARQLRCSNEYADEFKMVAEAWTKKLLPNF